MPYFSTSKVNIPANEGEVAEVPPTAIRSVFESRKPSTQLGPSVCDGSVAEVKICEHIR